MTEEEKDTNAFDRAVKTALDGRYDELGIVEDGKGQLLMPAAIQRRKKDGTLEDVPVMLRVPTTAQRHKARKEARERINKLGLDEEKDVGMFSELESFALLAFAIRDPDPMDDGTYVQHRKSAQLLEAVDDSGDKKGTGYMPKSLSALWAKLDAFAESTDPRFGDLEGEDMWKVIERIAHVGNASPLADIAGFEQNSLVTSMAKMLVKSRTENSPVA